MFGGEGVRARPGQTLGRFLAPRRSAVLVRRGALEQGSTTTRIRLGLTMIHDVIPEVIPLILIIFGPCNTSPMHFKLLVLLIIKKYSNRI